MCGIIGVYAGGRKDVIAEIYDGMLILQHRGQDAAGVTTYNGTFHTVKGTGLVRDIFNKLILYELRGNIGVGHTRYPTIGGGSIADAQPFTINTPFGISMVHNGNITNYKQLKQELLKKDLRHLYSACDVEVILNVFASELQKQNIQNLKPEHVFNAVENVFKRVKGSYTVVGFIAQKGMFAFRDPFGIKPGLIGEKEEGKNKSYLVASESIVHDVLGYNNRQDIKPGEVIFVDKDMRLHRKTVATPDHHPCIFEYIYFARPDSVLDGISVYKTRLRLGNALAKQFKQKNVKVSAVIPIPETSTTAALTLAYDLGVKYREGFIKNRYIDRTFIMPDQEKREESVKFKLNPIKLEFQGKNVLLVDDSIVRGTTSKKIIDIARKAGAKKVYFASTCPPLRYPCVYGIDMSTKDEFIAKKHSIEEIEKIIGADLLVYQTKEDMIKAAQMGNPKIKHFCTACFDGNYPTGDVTEEMLNDIEHERLIAQRKLKIKNKKI